MGNLPIPEIVAALVISTIAVTARLAWREGRARFRRKSDGGTRQVRAFTDSDRIRVRLLASCVLLVIVSVPLIFRLVPPNGIYGFRTGATRSTPAIWYSANAFMGWALSVAAIVTGALLVLLPVRAKPWLLWAVFIVPLVGAIALSFGYLSYL